MDGALRDVQLHGGMIRQVSPPAALAPTLDEDVVEGRGGALLPGLHDHHLHLLAMAAADRSVDVSTGLGALRAAGGQGWLRAVGWAAGGDRQEVDRAVAGRPVRVQHRSGSLWVLNSAAVDLLGLADAAHPGIERDAAGLPTGRLWRMDDWLAARLPREPPELATTGQRLAALGITGVTDATPDLGAGTVGLLRRGVPQHLVALGDPRGPGPVKIVVADSALPSPAELAARIARARPRPVAVHCVSLAALVILLAALAQTGSLAADRVEHGSVVPAELIPSMPTVVTQPGFVAVRGDDYLRDVEAADIPDLYRYRSLREAGILVVTSSDAPFGPVDPWAVIRAARDRRTPAGVGLGTSESVPAGVALDGYLRDPLDLRLVRRICPGAPADVVLLDVGLDEALADPAAEHVRGTWIAGIRHHWT